jgi:class 3 adenylate cyclase
MVPTPETRYASCRDLHVAYQLVGDGPIDVVLISEWGSHLEVCWDQPYFARALMRLSSFSRLVLFDRRGTGLSDPIPLASLPSLEDRMDDLLAVLDAADIGRTALVGTGESGPLTALFAATYPERTTALVLVNSYPRLAYAEDYPIGIVPEIQDQLLEVLELGWGSGVFYEVIAPSLANDVELKNWYARYQRLSASPGVAPWLFRQFLDTDVRDVLGTIRVPTLVLHRRDDRFVLVEHGRYLADNIPGAAYVELTGEDHLFYIGEVDRLLDEIEEFLTGAPSHAEVDRTLATVMFTDIVDSTKRAVAMGDLRWRDLLDAHHGIVRHELSRYNGREIDTAGDGFFATFDGPARAIRCACAVRDGMGGLGIDGRVGVHTGEVEIRDGSLSGVAVHIGARVAGVAGSGEVLVSSTVKDLVAGSGIAFVDRGIHPLKGVPGEWRLFAVDST